MALVLAHAAWSLFGGLALGWIISLLPQAPHDDG